MADFLDDRPNRLTVQYHDQCAGEEWTRVYARAGHLGPWTLIESDPSNQGGWRTATFNDLDPQTNYCFYVRTRHQGVEQNSAIECRSTPQPRCGPPVIGGSDERPPFPNTTATSITVQYNDQCNGEDWTRIYARRGTTGAFTEIESDGGNHHGYRTTVHSGLDPSTMYSFYAQSSVDGYIQSSSIHYVSTPGPSCPAPAIIAPFPEVLPDRITVRYDDKCVGEKSTYLWGKPASSSTWPYVQGESAATGLRDRAFGNLSANHNYCFAVSTTGPDDYLQYSAERCVRTSAAFQQQNLTPAESEQIISDFDWRDTHRIPEGPADQRNLYYMNILIDDAEFTEMLRRLGAHVQEDPVFPGELDQFSADNTIVRDATGNVLGRWVYAIVPGDMYNALREDNIAALERGDAAPVPAMVMRLVPIAAARSSFSKYALSYQYLGEQGFEYNAILPSDECAGQDVCTIQQAFIGWLGRKLFSISGSAFRSTVEWTRERIGGFAEMVRGEMSLNITFQLMNTDPVFIGGSAASPVDTALISGWSGRPIALKNVKVRVRQSVASFTGQTDENGQVTVRIAKNNSSKICVDLENKWLKMTGLLNTHNVCVHSTGGFGGDESIVVPVKHSAVQAFATISDTAEYVETVLGYRTPKVEVLIGHLADLLAVANRSFAPCFGRMPNLSISAVADMVGPMGWALEALLSVDVVLEQVDLPSRAIASHEYGHAVMCTMMGGEVHTAYAEVIARTKFQRAEDQPSYITEAFADFITSQSVGATGYFGSEHYVYSLNSYYNVAVYDADTSASTRYEVGDGLEYDFTEADTADLSGYEEPGFNAQVRRVTSLLHDAFDGHSDLLADPNDGTHWWSNPLGYLGNNNSDLSDEPVAMSGRCLAETFSYWRDHSSRLTEDEFLRALARTMLADGYTMAEVCDVFSRHNANGACPSYVTSLNTTVGGDRCSSGGGSGGGGSGGGGQSSPLPDPELPPTSNE